MLKNQYGFQTPQKSTYNQTGLEEQSLYVEDPKVDESTLYKMLKDPKVSALQIRRYMNSPTRSNNSAVLTRILEVYPKNVHLPDESGAYPIHIAASSGSFLVLQTLVDNGARIAQINKQGQTALHLAAGAGRKDIVNYLIEKGADINAQDKSGKTPLHCAAIGGQIAIAGILCGTSCIDVDLQNNKGETADKITIVPVSDAIKTLIEETREEINKTRKAQQGNKSADAPTSNTSIINDGLYPIPLDEGTQRRNDGNSFLDLIRKQREKRCIII